MTDYPAAHSMDTEWFAVDADGNIALFDSGEGGAVPEATNGIFRSSDGDGLTSLCGEIAKMHPNRLIKIDTPSENLIPGLTLTGMNECVKSGSYNRGLVCDFILLLESVEIIPMLGIENIKDNFIVQFAGEPTIAYIHKYPAIDLQKLIDRGQAIAGKLIYGDISNYIAALCGFFVYEHSSHALIPYNRSYIPQYPFKLENLADRLQELITLNWFDRVKFVESELVQPIEHTPCDAWSDTQYWIDTNGIEHQPEDLLRNTWNPINKTWIDDNGVEY
jgi:hypothetical protein